MDYKKRHIESKLLKYSSCFPAILLNGARQVGKSTLLSHFYDDKMDHVVFDPVIDIGNARQDPEFFLNQQKLPIILDEIQFVPELLPVIKRVIDKNPKPGLFFLTGSQNLLILKQISESLAGRVMVLDLGTMSLAERLGHGLLAETGSWVYKLFDAKTDIPDLSECSRTVGSGYYYNVFAQLWRGGFPGILQLDNDTISDYFRSYTATYVERDIRVLAEVSDQQQFSRFLSLCAALTAKEINYSQLGREIGVTPQTALRWLAILKATYQWLEVFPYHGNTIKRLSGKPKGYITDTGFASYLQHISSPEALSGHPLLGSFFETHVVLDLHCKFSFLSTAPQCYHWRSHGGAEVALLLERDGIFWPIEIKCKAKITKNDARGIKAFKETYPQLTCGPGIIIAPVLNVSKLDENTLIVPYDLQ